MPLFAEAGIGCSGTGPDRAVGRQEFLLLAPWLAVLSWSWAAATSLAGVLRSWERKGMNGKSIPLTFARD